MVVRQLGHLAFVCADLEASIKFYRDVLGLKEKFRIDYGDWLDSLEERGQLSGDERARLQKLRGTTWIAYMEIESGAFIELFDAGGHTQPAVPDGSTLNYQHLALLVDDIFEAHEYLKRAGAPIDVPPALGLEGTYQMWSHDPDFNKIEFMQYTKSSWQLTGKP